MAYDHLKEQEIDLDEQSRRYNEEMSYYETDGFGERLGEPREDELEAEEDILEDQILAGTKNDQPRDIT